MRRHAATRQPPARHRPRRAGHRPGRGRGVPAGRHARDLQRAARRRHARRRDERTLTAGGRAAHRRQHRPGHLDAAHRRPGARRRGHRHRRARSRCRSATSTKGHVFNALGESLDVPTAVAGGHRALGDPPRPAAVRPARAADRDARDRHQGHRPAHPVRPGRQDRPVRRRRRGQDRAHPGDDHAGSPRTSAASRCSPGSASGPARATTCSWR